MDLTPNPADKIGYEVHERWRAMPNRDAYVATMMATAARDGYRAGREDAVPATCQENALPERFGVFVDAHLHECSREADHRSRVHRCACGVEWWLSNRCSCPDCDVTTFSEKPGSRTAKGLDPACPVHGGNRLTEKSCLLVDGAHGRHGWVCSTPGCAGHVCLGSISLGRSSQGDGDNPEEQRP